MIVCLGVTPAVQRVMVFDGLEVGEVNRAKVTQESVAGKSINVAKVLKDLGSPVLATGFLGGDRGRTVREEFDRRGIQHDFIEVPPRTRMCVTVIDRPGGTITELVEESIAVPEHFYHSLLASLGQMLGGAKMLILSGTLTPGAPTSFYRDCVMLAARRGLPCILDSQKEPLLLALDAGPTWVKPNRRELGAALNMAIDTLDQVKEGMKRLVQAGAKNVMISMGAEGALALADGRFFRIHAPRIEAVNPIGSGDATTAGLAVSLLRGCEPGESLAWACACGSANALTEMAGEVRMEDAERLRPMVRISEI